MNVVRALCVGRLGRAYDPGLCLPCPSPAPASRAHVCPSLVTQVCHGVACLPLSATVLAPLPCPALALPCLRHRQRHPHDRGGDIPTRDIPIERHPIVRCVVVVVVDHQRQPINRINESNCNQLRIESTDQPINQPRQPQPDQPRHNRHTIAASRPTSTQDQQPANRHDREMERRKIALGKIALGNRPPPGPPPPPPGATP
jgi:hypothetical protein